MMHQKLVDEVNNLVSDNKSYTAEELVNLIEEELLLDLDEIDNKPWRVFRQLAILVPDCETDYKRYARFYEAGGGKAIESMIALWEKTREIK